MKITRLAVTAYVFALLIILLDQATKAWVISGLSLHEVGRVAVLPPLGRALAAASPATWRTARRAGDRRASGPGGLRHRPCAEHAGTARVDRQPAPAGNGTRA